MGEGWEQRNAALPLMALEGMQLASPSQLSRAFGKGVNLTFGHHKHRKSTKTQEESAFCLVQQD